MKRLTALCLLVVMLFSFLALPARANGTEIIIHYRRGDGDYEKWNIWAWAAGKDGAAYPFTGEDSYGKIAVIEVPGAANSVGFIVRTDSWEKDVQEDRFIDLSLGNEIWVMTEQTGFAYEPPEGYEGEPVYFETLEIVVHRNRYDGLYGYDKVFIDGAAAVSSAADSFGKLHKFTLTGVNSGQKPVLSVNGTDYELSLRKVPEGAASMDVYSVQGRSRIGYAEEVLSIDKYIVSAKIDGPHEINVRLSYPVQVEGGQGGADFSDTSVSWTTYTDNTGSADPEYGQLEAGYATEFTLRTEHPVDIAQTITVAMSGYAPAAAVVGNFFNSGEFEDMFTYTGELGALYTKEKTTFRLWAPTASEARVNLFSSGWDSRAPDSFEMTRAENGVWELEMSGDRSGTYYTYTVNIGGEEREAVDPYAKAAGVNGRRGMVIDLDATDPAGWESDKAPDFGAPTDAIVYELHVRDFSTGDNSGMVNKGKYLAFTETGTTNAEGLSTGVDHLTELGVTHIHLLPVFDFRSVDESKPELNSFNWGYDPENYNLPEGSYATDPYEGEVRINEFKQMVQSLHSNGLRVVMDVVYNHTGATQTSNLNLLVPDYYYRQNEDGGFSNGSGCGNETASERAMVRKLIVDSVVYWAAEYHIDGFRFDLMALHDIETMNAVRAALDDIDPSILIYGEGWTAGGTPLPAEQQALKDNARFLDERIAVFSDDMRDGIKGNVFNAAEPGYINGDTGKYNDIRFGVVGSVSHPQVNYPLLSITGIPWAKAPSQTINYASSHDNLSLWDKLRATRPDDSEEEWLAMNKLSALLVLTSQGIPFFQAGEEFARSKYGEENSYKSPDSVNQLKWERKTAYNNLFEYYKGLIALRKAYPAFRMTSAEEIAQSIEFLETDPAVLAYTIRGSVDGTFAVVVNADEVQREVKLPEAGWVVLADGSRAGVTPLENIGGDTVTLAPKSGVVMMLGHAGIPEARPDTKSAPVWLWAALGALLAAGAAITAGIFLDKKKR